MLYITAKLVEISRHELSLNTQFSIIGFNEKGSFLGKMGQSRSEAHVQNATFDRENILRHLADITMFRPKETVQNTTKLL